MHVLTIPSWYFSAGSRDIGGRNFHSLASEMRAEGIDARIYFGHYSISAPVGKKSTNADEDGVPTWRVSHWFPPKVHPLLLETWINKYLRDLQGYIQREGKPDLIHAHSYLAALVASALKRKMKIPYVYTEHLSGFLMDTIPALHKNFISQNLSNADMITCVSPGLKSKLQLLTSSAIEVVPNYYDPKIFYADPQVKKNEKFTWVTIGEPMHTKGLDLIIAAFARIKHDFPQKAMQLILIDDIKEKKTLQKMASDGGVAESLQWTGLITQEEIADILRRSHVFISGSRVETFGTAIIEAQGCGIPVVATPTDGSRFILTDPSQGIIANAGDENQLYKSMRDIYLRYDQYDPAKIIASVEVRFTKEMVIEKWKALYSLFAQ